MHARESGLFGFQLEITATRHLDAGWRQSLLKETLETRTTNHGFRIHREDLSPGRRSMSETVATEQGCTR